MKRRRFHTRPAAAPYVDRLECPSCRRFTVTGRRSFWGLALLSCALCDLNWTVSEYEHALEAATDIARRQVHELPDGGAA